MILTITATVRKVKNTTGRTVARGTVAGTMNAKIDWPDSTPCTLDAIKGLFPRYQFIGEPAIAIQNAS